MIGFDLDKFNSKKETTRIFNLLKKDKRTFLMFRSPSMSGIKLWFKFSTKITDAHEYSKIHKSFKKELTEQLEIDEKIWDVKVSDVTRPCFMSFDKQMYLNEDCDEEKYIIDLEGNVWIRVDEVLG